MTMSTPTVPPPDAPMATAAAPDATVCAQPPTESSSSSTQVVPPPPLAPTPAAAVESVMHSVSCGTDPMPWNEGLADSLAEDMMNIKIATEPKKKAPTVFETEFSPFMEWLDFYKGTVHKVDIQALEGFGKCVVAADSIAKGERVISIPPQMWISESLPNPLLSKVIRGTSLRDKYTNYWLCAMQLEAERHVDGSPWQWYLDKVAPSLPKLPVFLSEKQLKTLDTTVQDECRPLAERVKTCFGEVFPLLFKHLPKLFSPEKSTLETFKQSLITVWSRGTTIQGRGGPQWAVIPMLDFFNHHQLSQNTSSIGQGGMNVYCERNYSKGEQIYLSYGVRSSLKMFVFYGFVPQSNPNDYILLRLTPTEKTRGHELFGKRMSSLVMGKLPQSAKVYNDGKISPQFLLACSVLSGLDTTNNKEIIDHMISYFQRQLLNADLEEKGAKIKNESLLKSYKALVAQKKQIIISIVNRLDTMLEQSQTENSISATNSGPARAIMATMDEGPITTIDVHI
eukprot:GFYU01000616.1.p1 GENE.GFYU01000616.1~~GFYU01000616.1.p1  ORF type:complete len:510 (+),score=123.78 GFYU01000616.1:114-1643(+)